MSAVWTFKLTPRARKALTRLDHPTATRVLKALKQVTGLPDPRQRAKPLTGTLAGLWRYRVGDYRVICDINDDVCVILALDIDHRSRVYR